MLKFLLVGADAILIYVSLMVALGIRYADFSFWPGPRTRDFVWHFALIGVVWILFLYILDFYEVPPIRDRFYFIYNLAVFALLAGGFGSVYFYTRQASVIAPKTILGLHVCLYVFWVFASRFLIVKGLDWVGAKEKIVIIGSLSGLSREIVSHQGFDIVKRFRLESLDVAELRDAVRQAGTIVFPSALLRETDLVKKIFSELPLNIKYISYSEFYEDIAGKVPLGRVEEGWFLENLSRQEHRIEYVSKRAFDIFFGGIGLLVFVLVIPFIALVIKLDSKGPIFYSQKRVGKGGRHFILHKLRTMTVGAEQGGAVWAKAKDLRVTKVGKILRAGHIDEFPQFLNILKGELSFVGPRPERPVFVAQLKQEIPFYDIRHLVKPGFTGWAQINYRYGASVKDAEEKLKYDLYYVKNRNLLFDLSIILKTVRIIFKEM